MIREMFKRSMSARSARVLDPNRISQLIYEQDWPSLLIALGSQNSDDDDWFTTAPGNAHETTLHICCQFQAPFYVICAIYRLYPQAVDHADEHGRFPIHIACCFGAEFEVIEFLIQVSSEQTVAAQDRIGRTPLHLTCEHYHYKRDSQLECSQGVGVVKMLCGKAPNIINIEDDDGRTAVEMAIEYVVPFKVVRALQKISAADWKARREGQESHEGMRNEFKRLTSSRRLLLEREFTSESSSTPKTPRTEKTCKEKLHPLPRGNTPSSHAA